MSSNDCYGEFEPAVEESLRVYGGMLRDAGYGFDLFEGFTETPDKPYSAKSEISIETYDDRGMFVGNIYSRLVLVVFEPGDGTGDESLIAQEKAKFSPKINGEAKYLPRSKEAIHSEAHLTIAAKTFEESVIPFAGSLDLSGLNNNGQVEYVHGIGQKSQDFVGITHGLEKAKPTATLTTGYSSGIHNPNNPGERFGDPHAVVNEWHEVTQVAGFIAVGKANVDLIAALGAIEPGKSSL